MIEHFFGVWQSMKAGNIWWSFIGVALMAAIPAVATMQRMKSSDRCFRANHARVMLLFILYDGVWLILRSFWKEESIVWVNVLQTAPGIVLGYGMILTLCGTALYHLIFKGVGLNFLRDVFTSCKKEEDIAVSQ